METLYNFGAGPAALPHQVITQAQAGLENFQDTGISILSVSHRSKAFSAMAEQAEADLRELLTIPKNYHVLFLQGGASSQFAQIPMNLLGENDQADYIDTGYWSQKAIAEAQNLCQVNIAASAQEENYGRIPPVNTWQLNPKAAYVHITYNETIHGLEFPEPPDTGTIPLVADMSSTLLSRPLDIQRFGLIYAGAQKNLGPAGVTLVIIRDDLLGRARGPAIFNYQHHAHAKSCYNTPPCFAWYVVGLVLQWAKQQGGVTALGIRNQDKAQRLYACLDGHALYRNPVDPKYRSWMNIPFILQQSRDEARLLAYAKQQGLVGLKGHRAVGGLRASLYNAMPVAGVETLIDCLNAFTPGARHV